jgi:hypothetical protein
MCVEGMPECILGLDAGPCIVELVVFCIASAIFEL